MLSISTSGSDILSIGYEQYDYAKKVIAGIIKDPAFFGLVYEADPTDDWTKPETWYKANPSLGHIITEADMRQRCTEALESPSKQSAFKRLRLNLWVNADDPFFSMDRWDACGAKPLLPEALFGRDCYAALDLAATDDLSALTLTFPPMEPGEPFKALSWYWLPEEGLDKKSQKHGVRYDVWKDEGFLFTTPGPATDYEFIVQHLVRLKGQFNIIRVVYDPWKAQSTVNRLNDEGFEVVEVRQVISNFTGPMYELERLILQGEYAHGGNPITRWCAANTVAYTDANDNVRPSKIKSKNKIDGVVTSIMSLGQAMVHVESCSSMTLSEGIVWIDD